MLADPPLSLYVHLPWCVRKCPYCDFNSHVHKGALPEQSYVTALLADLEREAAVQPGRTITTIFFGGGTPSLFTPEAFATLLEGIAARVAVSADVEVTLEANPGTVEHGRFAGYREAGINRVSIGAQSFSARHLSRLGRIHGPQDTVRAAGEVVAAGLCNFNVDLMHGLPDQALSDALSDVEQALALAPTHVSHYQLTLEPGTVFYAQPPSLPDDDQLAEIQERTHARLQAAGFRQYEVSAWSRPGHECRHNLNYWRFGDYLGIGAGAHGKLTDAASNQIWRTVKPRQPREYLAATQEAGRVGTRDPVPVAARPFEFMLNALRLASGFEQGLFESRTGLSLTVILPTLEVAERRGLLAVRESGWTPTVLGYRFLNDLQALFLPE